MKFRLEIEIDGAAFNRNASGEVTALLRSLSHEVEEGKASLLEGDWWEIIDSNGTHVGFAIVEE